MITALLVNHKYYITSEKPFISQNCNMSWCDTVKYKTIRNTDA